MAKTKVAGTPGLDPTLPDVTLILGGVERHLCFDFNSIALVEQHTGINLLKASLSDINATNLRALLWASLLKENENLSIEEVGSWITMRNANTVYTALITAWFGSASDPDADVNEGKETAQAKV